MSSIRVKGRNQRRNCSLSFTGQATLAPSIPTKHQRVVLRGGVSPYQKKDESYLFNKESLMYRSRD